MHLAFIALLLAGSQAASDIPYNFRRYALHAAAVLGDRMYIEGGDMATGSRSAEHGDDHVYTSITRSIPINTTWKITELEISQHSNSKNAMPALNRVSLWADEENGSLYRFGGQRSHGVPMKGQENHHLWSYKPGPDADWGASTPENTDVLSKFSYGVDGLSTFCDGVGLLAGGFGTVASDKRLKGTGDLSQTEIPGMLTYNTSSAAWSNLSATALSPSGARQGGQAVCATSFQTPLAAFIGGWNAPSIATQRTVDLVEADMNEITLYDVRSNKWFSQKTTGDAPKASNAFCAVGVQAELQANLPIYDIVVFGGRDHLNNTYGDVHILSIPSFQWTKFNIKAVPRIHHHCVMAGKSQMIVSGGVAFEWDWTTDDPWKNGIGVLDLNKMAWSDKFDAQASEYSSPDSVQSWYTNASMKSVKWNSDELKQILGAKRYEDLETLSSGATSSSGANGSPKKNTVGAIVGGLVGAIAFLAIVAGLAFLFRRRQQQAKQRAQQANFAKSPVSGDGSGFSEAASTPQYEADSLPQFEADSLPQHEADSLPTHEADSRPIGPASSPSNWATDQLQDRPELSYDSQALTELCVPTRRSQAVPDRTYSKT